MTGVLARVSMLATKCVEVDRTMILIMVDAFLLVVIVVPVLITIVLSALVVRTVEHVMLVNTGILTISSVETLTLTVAVVREPDTITT